MLIKNIETNAQRIAQVVILDPPRTHGHASGDKGPVSHPPNTMIVFPSYRLPSDDIPLLDQDIAYLSPLLAFNLDLHVSCLKSLVHQGNETLASLFYAKMDNETTTEVGDGSLITLGLEPLAQLPRYASHLRVSFIKIPECGTLESLKGSSSVEAEERQELIDLALHNYFKVDRYLARGDIFNICINWNCNSVICIPCSQRSQNRSDNVIYFKVNFPVFFLGGTKGQVVVIICQAFIQRQLISSGSCYGAI